jgi:hypothetical protein
LAQRSHNCSFRLGLPRIYHVEPRLNIDILVALA